METEKEKSPGLETGHRLAGNDLRRAQLWTQERRNLSFCSSKERADCERDDKSNGAILAKRKRKKKKRRRERPCEERICSRRREGMMIPFSFLQRTLRVSEQRWNGER